MWFSDIIIQRMGYYYYSYMINQEFVYMDEYGIHESTIRSKHANMGIYFGSGLFFDEKYFNHSITLNYNFRVFFFDDEPNWNILSEVQCKYSNILCTGHKEGNMWFLNYNLRYRLFKNFPFLISAGINYYFKSDFKSTDKFTYQIGIGLDLDN